MQENQYKEVYEELQLLTNNAIDEYKLYLIRDKNNGNYRMAKKMNIYETTDSSQDETLNEVKILKDLKNPHVIKYYDVFIQNEQFITILEFCEEGDLEHYLKRRKDRKQNLSEKLILSWVMQLLMALEYIHSKNIIHRMISTKNIYLNHQGDVKFGSFGRARTLQNTLEKAMTVVGSPCNLSPQAVQGHPYDSKIDIWALGCVIYELATFKHPYQIKNLAELYEMIVKNPPLQLPMKYSKYLNPIYKKMMKKNPNSRPSARELLEQNVFVKLMKQYTKKKKIDALDLRQITPKQLAIHKRKKVSILPPLSPSPNILKKQNKQHINRDRIKNPSSQKKRQKSREKKSSRQKVNTANQKTKKQSSQKQQTKQKQVKEEQVLSDSKVSVCERITEPKLEEAEYISILYQLKLELLEEKYSPKMSQIFQQPIEFDEE